MQNKNITYYVNNKEIQYNVQAEHIKYGNYENLFLNDDNLIQDAEWLDEGITVQKFLDDSDYELFQNYINDLFKLHLSKITTKSLSDFKLEKYHEYVSDETHKLFLSSVTANSKAKGGLSIYSLPFHFNKIDNRISDICKRRISCKNIFTECFWLRVVRPQSNKDNNPPHKDGYLKRNRKMINLYVGIAGSNENSSLPFAPHSHLLNEKYIERTYGKTLVNGVKFTNPAVTGLYNKQLKMITPNPGHNQVLVFTPYVIHGGGRNLNDNTTRISLEMRFKKEVKAAKFFGFYN
jgi:hypothetical protein